MEIGEDVYEEGGAGGEGASDGALIEGGDADAAVGERHAEGLDESVPGVQGEDDAVVRRGDAERDDGLGVAEEREQGAAGQLEGEARCRGREGREERGEAAEVSIGRARGVDGAEREGGRGLPRELHVLADLGDAVDHAREGTDRAAVGDHELH